MAHEIRIRLGAFGRKRYDITCSDAEAPKREEKMREVARDMVDAGLAVEADAILKRMGTAADAKAFETAVKLADGLCDGKLAKTKPTASSTTFRAVAKQWTSGALHREYPDHVRLRDYEMDASRLEKLCRIDVGGKALGDVPLSAFTVDHAEEAMRRLPAEAKRPATRRQYAQLIGRVLGLAVYPLRLIPASPLPRGFLPKVGKPPAYAYLYPLEDAALMANQGLPLGFRVLFGFLAREGCRLGEALGLTWRDLDLERGVVTLDRNKTDDARAWALDPGVVRALAAWKKRGEATGFVFVQDAGVISQDGLAERLRVYLRLSGVTRSELHTSGENRGQFRVHDLRGTFVTLSLANGKSETWVADRTGHTSSQMINRYRRAARSATELELGALMALDFAIPEFNPIARVGEGLAAVCSLAGWASGGPNTVGRPGIEPGTFGLKSAQVAAGSDAEAKKGSIVSTDEHGKAPWPTLESEVGQGGGPKTDVVEAALAEALRGATAAGKWDVVAQLARELEARREASTNVVKLDAERRRRER